MDHQMKKRFGQNFLRDPNLLAKIVRMADVSGKNVIEVGPGMGTLTQALCQVASKVRAYEIDKTLKRYLEELKGTHANLEIVWTDFLDVDLENLEETWDVVANVPYYITTPILFKILEAERVGSATLMVQKEVASRLLSDPGQKTYNALSVILQNRADVMKVMDVSRKMFHPVPNVDSSVVRIVKHEDHDPKGRALFETFVKHAFTQKRKTLVNNLHEGYGVPKSEITDFLVTNDLDPLVRAERLSVPTFRTLSSEWPWHDHRKTPPEGSPLSL